MILLLVMTLGTLAVLVAVGLHDQEALRRDWEMILAPWGEEAYQELEARADGEARMADYAYGRALRAREAGATREAVRLLDVGLRVLEHSSSDWIVTLRGMGVLSRMAGAIAAVEPLRPGDFRAASLWGLAAVDRVAHPLLVTTAERFRLRAYVLRRGFGVAMRAALRSAARLRAGAPDAEWDRLARLRADLRTLPAESLRTFRWLLVSLSAERR